MFRSPVDASAPPAAGLVGPLGSSSFSLPAVERALAEMEGASSGTTLGMGRRAGAPTSPIIGSAPSPTGQTQHEVLQNFFKSLLNTKDRSGVSPGTSAVSPGVGTSRVPPTGPRTSGGGAGGGGNAQADAGSGTEDG
jgi:dynein light intermediate chain 1